MPEFISQKFDFIAEWMNKIIHYESGFGSFFIQIDGYQEEIKFYYKKTRYYLIICKTVSNILFQLLQSFIYLHL